MNDKLLKRLGLNPDATAEQIEAAIHAHLDQIGELKSLNEELKASPPETNVAKLEKRIAQKISQSGGALNREQAIVALESQDLHGEDPKTAKKK